MKKSLLVLSIAAIAFTSCKKKETTNDFSATDLTGNAILKGQITKQMITPNQGFGYGTVNVPAANVLITVRVANNQLYPNSPTAQGSEVYSTTTDNQGNYSIAVKANGAGVTGNITVTGWNGTIDTLVNSLVKPGVAATFGPATVTRTLYKGVTTDYSANFVGAPTTGGGNNITIGTSIITGSVGIRKWQQSATTSTLFTLQTFTMANHPITLVFDKDPASQVIRTYTGTTDANGVYSFTVNCTNAGGFNNQAQVIIWDYATTRDTIMANSTVKQGVPGVYSGSTLTVNGCVPNSINNANYLLYNAFTPN